MSTQQPWRDDWSVGARPGGFAPPGFAPVGPPPPGQHPGPELPVRVDPVAGTPFGLRHPRIRPLTNGPAVGSLVTSIGSVLLSFVVGCLGVLTVQSGGGVAIGGAFAVPAGALGIAGVGLGTWALRTIARSAGRMTGRGTAIAGISCGAAGILLTIGALLLAVAAGAAETG